MSTITGLNSVLLNAYRATTPVSSTSAASATTSSSSASAADSVHISAAGLKALEASLALDSIGSSDSSPSSIDDLLGISSNSSTDLFAGITGGGSASAQDPVQAAQLAILKAQQSLFSTSSDSKNDTSSPFGSLDDMMSQFSAGIAAQNNVLIKSALARATPTSSGS